MLKFTTLFFSVALFSFLAQADIPPTVKEMSAFLSSRSKNPNCFAPTTHYTNLSVKWHTVSTNRQFTVKEQQILSSMIGSMPSFHLNNVSKINFWFTVAPTASSEDVIRGLYVIENILDLLAPDLFLVSQQLCS